MRVLAFSDSHGNISDVQRLLQIESNNNYDAIIAAGDLGRYGNPCIKARTIIEMLSPFSCPVLFVLGNSDPETDKEKVDWPINGNIISEEPIIIGRYSVVGLNNIYSVNPQLTKNKMSLLSNAVIKHKVDPRKLIIVTHERMYSLNKFIDAGPPLLYLYGHHHKPQHTIHKDTNFINCSTLDSKRSKWGAGLYWTIEINEKKIIVQPKPLGRPTRRAFFTSGRKATNQIDIFKRIYPNFEVTNLDRGIIYTPTQKTY